MKSTAPGSPAGHLLVIGYGNELRSDDGAGVRVAETVGKWKLPRVRVHTCHQLTPELVVPIAAADQVVFVDASCQSAALRTQEIKPKLCAQAVTHAVNPGSLLKLCEALYGRFPRAWWLMIPAEEFGFGEEMSVRCQKGVDDALREIRVLIEGRERNKASAKQKRARLYQRPNSRSRRMGGGLGAEINCYA